MNEYTTHVACRVLHCSNRLYLYIGTEVVVFSIGLAILVHPGNDRVCLKHQSGARAATQTKANIPVNTREGIEGGGGGGEGGRGMLYKSLFILNTQSVP